MRITMRKISIFTIVALLIQIVSNIFYINPYIALADTTTSNTTTPTQIVQSFNILEVEPGRNWDLNATTFSSTVFGKPVVLTQMAMPEFIANISAINGKYDIVYIGNKTSTGIAYNEVGALSTKLPPDSGGLPEYFSENDITNKRAKDVKDFIDTQQCTLFSSSIFTQDLKLTKLYKNFITYTTTDTTGVRSNKTNVKLINNINAADIASFYNGTVTVKRPSLTLKTSPKQYDGTNGSFETNTNRTLNFTYDVNNYSNATDNMIVKLYLDKNGDGLFKETEMAESTTTNTISHTVLDSFTGIIPWQLVALDTNKGNKTIISGEVAFKSMSDAYTPVVRVLQLDPTGNNFSLIKDLKADLKLSNQYDIRVTEMNVSDFDAQVPMADAYVTEYDATGALKKTNLTKVSKPTALSNYDMVILGFADSYGNSDIKTPAALTALKDFIATGQSVMFTHDVLTYHINKTSGVTYNITKNFRDYIGQSRYIDSNNSSELDADGTSKIIHDPYPKSVANTYGYTNPIINGGWVITTNTHKLNNGVITQYPYTLGDISVANTHSQWYQLDLEDENVIPWFTVDAGGDTKYDGRNYYYAYSKGNITYSGTGHSSPNSQEAESQLFVNTMLKAYRSANHKPTFKVNSLITGQNVSTSQEKLEFNFVAKDVDGDKMSGEVDINGKLYKTYDNIMTDDVNSVSILKSELASDVGTANTFTITVKVKDNHVPPAAAEDQTFTLNYLRSIPEVRLTSTADKDGYLVGDNVKVSVNASVTSTDTVLNTAVQSTSDSTKGPIYAYTYGTGLDLIPGNPWSLEKFIIEGTRVTPASQTNDFNFTAKTVGPTFFSDSMSYKYSNLLDGATATIPSDSSINIRSGKIIFKVIDDTSQGNAISKPLVIHVKKGSVTSTDITDVTTDTGGRVTLSDRTTDSYRIAVGDIAGYTLIGSKIATYDYTNKKNSAPVDFDLSTGVVSLSYDNDQPTITLRYHAQLSPLITLSHTPDNSHKTNASVRVNVNFDESTMTLTNKWVKVNGIKREKTVGGVITPDTDSFDQSINATITAGATSPDGIDSQPNVDGSTRDIITNINKTKPDGNVTYDPAASLGSRTGSVTSTLNYGAIGHDGNGVDASPHVSSVGGIYHTFSRNEIFNYQITDDYGNVSDDIPATVTWIDKTNPTAGYFTYERKSDGKLDITLHGISDVSSSSWVLPNLPDYQTPSAVLKNRVTVVDHSTGALVDTSKAVFIKTEDDPITLPGTPTPFSVTYRILSSLDLDLKITDEANNFTKAHFDVKSTLYER